MTQLLLWLADALRGFGQRRRKVRVLVHIAFFQGDQQAQWFVNVTNLSLARDVEVTGVWVAASPRIPVMPAQRPTPKRLKPEESWETWLPAAAVAHVTDVERRFRVRLSSGKVVKSRPNKHVPPAGWVPGP
jgi:hypothetical protein